MLLRQPSRRPVGGGVVQELDMVVVSVPQADVSLFVST